MAIEKIKQPRSIQQPRVVDVSRQGPALTVEIDASEAAELLPSPKVHLYEAAFCDRLVKFQVASLSSTGILVPGIEEKAATGGGDTTAVAVVMADVQPFCTTSNCR